MIINKQTDAYIYRITAYACVVNVAVLAVLFLSLSRGEYGHTHTMLVIFAHVLLVYRASLDYGSIIVRTETAVWKQPGLMKIQCVFLKSSC